MNIQILKDLKNQNRDNVVIHTLLSTIIGECERIAKDPNSSMIISIIQKMVKNNEETLKECPSDRKDVINVLKTENEFMSQFLPKTLTDSELIALISSQISQGLKMPVIMKYLSENYKGRYDGKKAVEIIKSLQNA